MWITLWGTTISLWETRWEPVGNIRKSVEKSGKTAFTCVKNGTTCLQAVHNLS